MYYLADDSAPHITQGSLVVPTSAPELPMLRVSKRPKYRPTNDHFGKREHMTPVMPQAPPATQPQPTQSSGWKDFLPQIAVGVGAALIVSLLTGKK